MYELCMWRAITASACIRLYIGSLHVLALLPLANAGAITQLIVQVSTSLL